MHSSPTSDADCQMSSWYLVRHGNTHWNLKNRIQGHTDVPLSETGRKKVRSLALELVDVPFSAVYSSDLSRAVDTAQILVNCPGVSVQTDPDLREFSYGEWEGLTLEEVQAQDSSGFAQRFNLRDVDFAAPGGESAVQLLRRVSQFFARASAKYGPDDNVLVTAHGGSIRALALCLLDLPEEHFWRFSVDCASLSVIRHYSTGGVLVLWNHTVPVHSDPIKGGP